MAYWSCAQLAPRPQLALHFLQSRRLRDLLPARAPETASPVSMARALLFPGLHASSTIDAAMASRPAHARRHEAHHGWRACRQAVFPIA